MKTKKVQELQNKLRKNINKATALAEKNTKRDKDGNVVLPLDDEWRVNESMTNYKDVNSNLKLLHAIGKTTCMLGMNEKEFTAGLCVSLEDIHNYVNDNGLKLFSVESNHPAYANHPELKPKLITIYNEDMLSLLLTKHKELLEASGVPHTPLEYVKFISDFNNDVMCKKYREVLKVWIEAQFGKECLKKWLKMQE